MTSREAVKMLEKAGFSFLRMGRGSHAIYIKDDIRVVVSMGTNLSPGMAGKIRSAVKK